ncbi:MAG TPA: amino acid adenylation domain-containing protein [Dokdonella sp.]|uniref:polyketide synthase n=1 Tax=Dokdonella sp. TaxID=2291710 RepID=UPI002D7EC314|nr:polyketide synthase [Dokdonella sp.]HET9032643.1 amino acid adenylation domain-containing protein [Dokdonella sp.]
MSIAPRHAETEVTLRDVLDCGQTVVLDRALPIERPLDADLLQRFRARAERLQIAEDDFFQIALAVLDARLTGQRDVCVKGHDGSVRSVQPGGKVHLDSWLTEMLASSSKAGATNSPSMIGCWARSREGAESCAAENAPAWFVVAGEPAALGVIAGSSPFTSETLQRLLAGLHEVLRGLADAENLAEVSPLSREERQRLLRDWNDTARARKADDTVHGLFVDMARASPRAIALISGQTRVSYAELETRARKFAEGLRTHGVVAGATVALLLDRGTDAIVAMLGILMAGGAYLPLDRSHPRERLQFALKDAKAVFAIVGDASLTKLDELGAPVIRVAALENTTDTAAIDAAESASGDGTALAYVMYTSGSTGEAKGVEIAHRSIIRLVRDVDYIRLDASSRILHAAPLGFDASTLEIWGALLNGGCVVIHPERIPSGPGLARSIQHDGARIAWLTAALFNTLVDDDPHHLAGLEQLLIGGEALSVTHVRRALAVLPATTIINGYGPTECTTFAATWPIPLDLPADTVSIPIGRPIADTRLYILNASGEPVPVGVIGELHIGGAGVARGYLGRPELTAERFVSDPFGEPGARMYRTGDLARWLAQGVVEFIGRADGQVKIRGFRIETAEVEIALARHPAVRAAAVIAREDRPGQKRLIAYHVDNGEVAPAQLRDFLARTLPEFMLPAQFVRIDALPLTANGKLDRRALPVPDSARPDLAVAFAPPLGATEQRICAVFADLVGIDEVGRDDNFFDLGGNSLLAVRAVSRLDDVAGALSITDFFRGPNARALAVIIDSGKEVSVAASRMSRGRVGAGNEPIAIVAMCGRFPGADNVEAFWDNLCAGRDSITLFEPGEIDPWVPREQRDDPAYVRARGVIEGVEDFDAGFFGISAREADLTDPQHRIFLELCWEVLERAGHVPDAHEAPVGIFAGMYNATYFQRHVSAYPDRIDLLGAFQVMLANEKDYIATRVAHKLNLTGPAVSVHTACSTSLVAICQAVDALRAGRCAMALAGGVSVTCPPRSGYLYQEGAMLSPDGHTRTFSADAQGTVFSDGAAVVLLKRLADAEADGNHVHAVIRGCAVNNDGAAKASFTAPSGAGQAAVIAMALDDAEVDARSISYVEAHGTATPLGDPIEIEGLTTAFRRSTEANGYCAIGSVKSNVGHLVIAAGAAGVIKTALALDSRRLPASLHVEALNPDIDFAHSPFVVNRALSDWQGEWPLRAGVSAFGVGGTNAHVVLEEAPPARPSDKSDGPQLLLLSARSSEALAESAQRLARHLQANPDENLADVAFTLSHGRKAFTRRTALVADDLVDAVAKLGQLNCARAGARVGDAGVVFMFPGQGAQYPGMGRDLHAREPVFRAALDECAELLAGELGFDLRERLFSDEADALLDTGITQPATFAIEYALARLWLSLGIVPRMLIGHSVGEFVAAVLAGVMSLADGLRLVARRGRLMQAQPAGAMLSVRLAAEQLKSRLPASLSLAVENGPSACVVAGEIADVETLRIALDADGIACRRLRTSHAFHSAMMDPVLEPFHAEVERIALSAPKLPIMSTLLASVLSDDDAISADYWTHHLRGTVRFHSALASLLKSHPAVGLVEIGPRATLTTLARQQTQKPRLALASLADSAQAETAGWLAAIGQLWAAGVPLDLGVLDSRSCKRRVRLPTYPFERSRHWLDAPASGSDALIAAKPQTTPTSLVQSGLPPEIVMATALPAGAPDRRPRVLSQLKSLIEDVSGIELDDADTAANFIELGLDSLALTQVSLQLSKVFGIKLSFRQLMENLSSLDSLVAHIDKEMPAEVEPAAAAAPIPAPAVAALPMPMPGVALDGSTVQQVIQQQMLIMQQQLALLGHGATAPSAASASAAPPAPASAPAAPPPALDSEEAALVHTRYDVKKAFGAIARIHSERDKLSERQRLRLDLFMRRYMERTRKSKAYTTEHRPHLADPRVVNGFRPLLKEIVYQIVVDRSKGARLWDLDGNEYIDALNGFGMSLFGWQPEFVLDAVRHQLERGYEIGPQHALAGEVAKRICAMTGFDRAGLCNTGSEAVMGAIRIARTVTGRNTLVIFSGSYHGIFDEVIVRGTKKLRSIPAAPGILRNTAEHVLVLDYGTPETLAIIRERASEIAAVLVEPVQSRRPDFQPREFLHELRSVTRDSGALLIFDEVVTGFRSHPRGAQHIFGVDVDLATYGKVLGGGFPIGVIAGKREYMDALDGGHWQFGDDSVPTVGVTYFAGTFVRHPLALAAAKAVLDHLAEQGPALQEGLNARTTAMVERMNTACSELGAPIAITHFSSVWKINFKEEHPMQDLLFAMMRSRDIHILDNFPCFMTSAHSAADFDAIALAFRESVAELQEADFLPRHKVDAARAFDAGKPPLPGARLGKDGDGNPAWFVPNPEVPGKYLKVEA